MKKTSALTVKNIPVQTRGQESRDLLEEKWIVGHLPLVKHIVGKQIHSLRRAVDFDDLISAGMVGLVKAARSFDPTRNVTFKTYAYVRIRGAVWDELRNSSLLPPNVRREVRRIEEAYRTIATRIGCPPNDEELAQAVNLPLEIMHKTLGWGLREKLVSIHDLNDDRFALSTLLPPDRAPTPDQQAERNEILEALTKAVKSLPQRDWRVLMLYYGRELTMKETAAVLGVTESRISQMHANALSKLSMKLDGARKAKKVG